MTQFELALSFAGSLYYTLFLLIFRAIAEEYDEEQAAEQEVTESLELADAEWEQSEKKQRAEPFREQHREYQKGADTHIQEEEAQEIKV